MSDDGTILLDWLNWASTNTSDNWGEQKGRKRAQRDVPLSGPTCSKCMFVSMFCRASIVLAMLYLYSIVWCIAQCTYNCPVWCIDTRLLWVTSTARQMHWGISELPVLVLRHTPSNALTDHLWDDCFTPLLCWILICCVDPWTIRYRLIQVLSVFHFKVYLERRHRHQRCISNVSSRTPAQSFLMQVFLPHDDGHVSTLFSLS